MNRSRLGVDVGGTFTDLVLYDESRGELTVGKRLTTPEDPSIGVTTGTESLLAKTGVPLSGVESLIHGTTLVANTIIERKGVKTGLITTRGFRDVLEIRNERRYDTYDLFLENPEPLVPRYLRREIAERVLMDGTVLKGLDAEEVRSVAAELTREGVVGLAVCLIHSYANPEHEQRVAELAREVADFDVTLSSQVCPEIREYERTSTTVANAYVRPLIRKYLLKLEEELRQRGLRGSLFIMLSSGGIATVKTAAQFPIRLIESGPAAGALAACLYGGLAGIPDIISFDMGGTTAKMCLIHEGQPTHNTEFEAARLHRFKKESGIPLKVPVIELVEIGAGGGSIAHLDRMGLLKVGPTSAGASPGPACYGQGGDEPTVTDADLVLGYLNADFFLGGEMALDLEAAQGAIREKIADPLRLDVVNAAVGIFEVVTENMATATRLYIAEKGRDPRHYTLVAFGGAGPVHAHRLARVLKLPRVLYPLGAGVTSALGLLVAPISAHFVQSYVARLESIDWDHLNVLFEEMEERATGTLLEAGAAREDIRLTRSADMRFVGQAYEVPVAIPGGKLGPDQAGEIVAAFYTAYERLFGRRPGGIAAESISWRVVGSSRPPELRLRFASSAHRCQGSAVKGTRPVYFSELKGFTECMVYDRSLLEPGVVIPAPAVIEERESTIVIGPSARILVDEHLSVIAELT